MSNESEEKGKSVEFVGRTKAILQSQHSWQTMNFKQFQLLQRR